MPSTYTLNNGIELIGTGEQSGTWGSTTNTNFELLDTALDGQVSVTLAATGSSGSPNTLPISDGASSNGRNRLVIFGDGGDLGGTAFVQLTPNDSEKIIYVRNNLSGSRSILLFQGTYNASNDYEVPAGTTAVVFFNGAGSGAVAANVFNNAHFDALNVVGSVTVGGGVTVTGTVDAGTVEFDNLSGTGAVSVTNILDEDNMASNSATALSTQQSIKAYVDSQVGTVDTLAEILANGNTTGGNDIVFSAGDNITNASGDLTLDVAGDIILDADGGDIRFKDGGTEFYKVAKNGDHVQLFSTIQDGDLTFNGFDGASHIVALTLDMSAAGAATFNAGVTLTGTLNVDSSTTNGFLSAGSNILNFGTSSNDTVAFYANNTEHMKLKPDGEVIINETGGAEGDLRVESDSNSHMLFVDAGDNSVGIAVSNPSDSVNHPDANLMVKGGISFNELTSASEGSLPAITQWSRGGAGQDLVMGARSSSGGLLFYTGNSGTGGDWGDLSNKVRMTINSDGNIIINEDGLNSDFRVESNSNAHALFVDAGTSRVGINKSSPSGYLHILGSNDQQGATLYLQEANNNTSDFLGTIYFGNNTQDNLSHITSYTNTNSTTSYLQFNSTTTGSVRRNLDLGATAVVLNEDSADIDFRVESDSNANMLFVDAGNNHVNIGNANNYGSVLNVFTTGTDALEIVSDNGNANAGPYLDITRKSGSPADGDLTGAIRFLANSDAAETIVASINTVFDDVSNASEDSSMFFKIRQAGAQPNVLDFSPSETIINNDSYDRDFRVESNNQSNMLTVDAGTDCVIIGGGAAIDTVTYFSLQGIANGDAGEVKVRTNGKNAFKFRNSSNGVVGSITLDASGTTYNTTSDRRLKTDIQPIADGTDKLMAMNPVRHKWIADPEANAVHGFIAQEMQEIIPEAVSGEPDGEEMMSMDYGRITPVLVAALQDAHNKITALEKRLAELETN